MDSQHILKNGKYYGYPECCILDFKEKFPLKFESKSDEQKRAAKYGFIPCPVHAREILEGKTRIEDLILPSRKEKRPFSKDLLTPS